MKKNMSPLLFCLAGMLYSLLLLSGCTRSASVKTRTYTIYTPQTGLKSAALANINGDRSQPVVSTGKIYIKDKTIFLNEPDKGIHVIDNSNPAHPVQKAFYAIPGNQDIAVKGNTLYADMYNDLLALDISDPGQVKISGRIANLFTGRQVVNGFWLDSAHVFTGWTQKDTTVPDTYQGGGPIYPGGNCPNCEFLANAGAPAAANSTGVAGSMAKMVLVNDYLYALAERHSLGIVSTVDAASPVQESTMPAGFDLETIYPFGNQLFLGSEEGMYMYDISEPAHPAADGIFTHGRACDPVVSDGDYAYITLHAGTYCGGSSNELDVVDIKNLQQPALVKTYSLTKPTGLCKDGRLLFVCDDASGVRVYDAANPAVLQQLTSLPVEQPYDVIAANNILLVVAKGGLYQYDYSNPMRMRLLSIFP